MEKHTIGGLKNILVASPNFYDIEDYFLTLTETNRAAIEGKGGKNKTLKEIISVTLAQICLLQNLVEKDAKIILMNMTMVEVRQRYFWHGSGFVNGKYIFTFFYFADLDKGMISISRGSNNFFARISVKPMSQNNPVEEFSDN